MTDLVETLNTIPWGLVRTQQSDCRDIPHAVLSLMSHDRAVRKSAYWELDNHVVVQGGLFEGAFYVIPFLLQICSSESSFGRTEALNLLFEIAAGACSFDDLVRFSTVQDPFPYFIPDPCQTAIPLAVAARFAVGCGLHSIVPLVASLDALEQKAAQDIISLFTEYSFGLNECLFRIAETTSDEKLRAKIRSLGRQLTE